MSASILRGTEALDEVQARALVDDDERVLELSRALVLIGEGDTAALAIRGHCELTGNALGCEDGLQFIQDIYDHIQKINEEYKETE